MPDQPVRVLLVDEDERSSAELADLLSLFNYSLDCAVDSAQALSLGRQKNYDALLVSLQLSSGPFAVCREITALSGQNHIPVAFLTDSGYDYLTLMEAKYYGAIFIIRKPFVEGDLLAQVSTMIRIKKLNDALRERMEELALLATQDPLTGLYNRRMFFDRLEEELTRSRRNRSPLSLIAIDIDHFKSINDSYGHLAGDRVLTGCANSLRGVMRGSDLLARIGGEEFSVLLPDTGLEGAMQVAERLRRAVEDSRMRYEGQRIPVTISLGVIEERTSYDSERLLQSVDMLLYEAKHRGRNRVIGPYDILEPVTG